VTDPRLPSNLIYSIYRIPFAETEEDCWWWVSYSRKKSRKVTELKSREGVAASSSALPCEAIKTARRVGSGHGVNGVHVYVSLKILVPEEDDMQESGSRDRTVI
jgi:hypothetical protein